MYRAAVALLVFTVPVFAQHGGAHAGSSGSRGSVGHAGFSGSPSFSRPGSFVRPAQPFRSGANGPGAMRLGANGPGMMRSPGFQRVGPPSYPGTRIPYSGSRLMGRQPQYRSGFAGNSRGGDSRNWDRDRDRFRDRRREFNNWYTLSYLPTLEYPYPYVIDPGFYDWGDTGDSANDQGSVTPNYPYTDQSAGYPDQGYGAPNEAPLQSYSDEPPPWNAPREPLAATAATAISAPVVEQPLTVIFNNGRAPAKMQNYMMTAKVLTDLDSHKYEQISLDEIDVAATRQANLANGIDFHVPGA